MKSRTISLRKVKKDFKNKMQFNLSEEVELKYKKEPFSYPLL